MNDVPIVWYSLERDGDSGYAVYTRYALVGLFNTGQVQQEGLPSAGNNSAICWGMTALLFVLNHGVVPIPFS
eukprot:31184-Eustigmatos_ZCMA.PRE.1